MENNRKEIQAMLESAIKELPAKAREAICWAIVQFDFVRELCENSEMTAEEIEKCKRYAREKEDDLMLVLLCAAEAFQKDGDETAKQRD